MRVRPVRQAISPDSLFRVLTDWCRSGAGRRSDVLRILTAFASGNGVAAISPLLDVFLADGNSVEIIFGVDRNGTDRAAVQRLFALQKAHTPQLTVSVFQAPSAGSIFHPKLYIYERPRHLDFVIGSSNLTSGGLGSNLESLLFYRDVQRGSKIARDVMSIWRTYAAPRPPLSPAFLRDLTARYARRLSRLLRRVTPQEPARDRRPVRNLWRPLSRVRLPRSARTIRGRQGLDGAAAIAGYLVTDILRETRRTQMQIPLEVVEHFFGIDRRRQATITVSILAPDGLTQPIIRPLVVSGLGFGRLMRRLEVPQIRSMARPLIGIFLRLRGQRRFGYVLLRRGSREYTSADKLLRDHGQQGTAVRRYLIGRPGDRLWREVSTLLPRA